MADALGRAMLDYQRGSLRGEVVHRDGDTTWDGNVAEFYFSPPDQWREEMISLYESLPGPVLDVGCGAGQHALFLRERGREVLAFDVSPNAVQAARERRREAPPAGGSVEFRVLDMFEMDVPDRFGSVLCNGTQLGLGGSLPGVRQLLSDFAAVTTDEGVAVVDGYDPRTLDPAEFGGYRPDPRDDVARRTFHVEYHRTSDESADHGAADSGTNSGEAGDETVERLVGDSLSFLLFGPGRLRDAVVGTPWRVAEVYPGDGYYKARLEKE
jgi:SAM-dependent methyltransferase